MATTQPPSGQPQATPGTAPGPALAPAPAPSRQPAPALRCRTRTFPLGQRTYVMGILNVTPDSFSDGNAYLDPARAVEHGLRMAAEGADLIDVGGESTRPGAPEVPADEELRRVLPVIRALAAQTDVPISIDTRKAAVARAAVEAGAQLVNDVSGLAFDPEMAPTVARLGVPVVVMHMRGTPATMQSLASYRDVVAESAAELRSRLEGALAAGIAPDRLIIDPGIGFAKTAEHNLELLRSLARWRRLAVPAGLGELPVLVGTSRKSFIGHLLGGLPPDQRLEGTAATVALAIAAGADFVRVHDVLAMSRVARMADALVRGPGRAAPAWLVPAPAPGAGSLAIELSGLTFSSRHGVYPEEKQRPQPFVVDVKMWLDEPPRQDRLDETIDYGQVYRWVREAVEGPPVDLIETLAARIADAIRQRCQARLRRLRVRLHKPGAPLPGPAQDVAVELEL